MGWAPLDSHIPSNYPSSHLRYVTFRGRTCLAVLTIFTLSAQYKLVWWLNQPLLKNISQIGIISPGRGEHKNYLKPPPKLINPGSPSDHHGFHGSLPQVAKVKNADPYQVTVANLFPPNNARNLAPYLSIPT